MPLTRQQLQSITSDLAENLQNLSDIDVIKVLNTLRGMHRVERPLIDMAVVFNTSLPIEMQADELKFICDTVIGYRPTLRARMKPPSSPTSG